MGMLDGKVAIITGATSGIGARTTDLFIEEGAKVVFTGRRKANGEALAAKLGKNASFVRADATLEEDWRRVVEQTLATFGNSIACLTMREGLRSPAASPRFP